MASTKTLLELTAIIAKQKEQKESLIAMIEELVWAMNLWCHDEDSEIHPDAFPAFKAAIVLVGIPVAAETNDYGDTTYHFNDLDWVQRQRDKWRERNPN